MRRNPCAAPSRRSSSTSPAIRRSGGSACASSRARPSRAQTTRRARAPSWRSGGRSSRGADALRFELLSSTPPSPTEGSGTWVALDGLARGLVGLGHTVDFRLLRIRTPIHTFTRWLYNRQVAARPPTADVVVGVDLDGYQWASNRKAQARRGLALIEDGDPGRVPKPSG